MTDFISRFKIPTILGLSIIFLGIIIGVYLNLQEQIFFSKATPQLQPQNITIANITDNSAAVSWQTESEVASFITYGPEDPKQFSALDDQDKDIPIPHSFHYVTLQNLLPETTYKFRIVSGKTDYDVNQFNTAKSVLKPIEFPPVIGSALEYDMPIKHGIAYLSIPTAATQSALIKQEGNFLIPLAGLRKDDLSELFSITENTIAKLTVVSSKGTASLLFRLDNNLKPLPPLKIGQNLDITTVNPISYDLDLNKDGQINSADYAFLTACFVKNQTATSSANISCVKADINKDGKIDQKDLDLMIQKITD